MSDRLTPAQVETLREMLEEQDNLLGRTEAQSVHERAERRYAALAAAIAQAEALQAAERERDALNVMAAVCEWQARNDYHPLTCGNDQCRADNPNSVLVPLIRDETCVLACPQCDYIQTHIPSVVLSKEAHP